MQRRVYEICINLVNSCIYFSQNQSHLIFIMFFNALEENLNKEIGYRFERSDSNMILYLL